MSSTTGLGLTTTRPNDRRSPALARSLSATILVLLFVSGGILAWRRLAGALSQPLPAESLATLGLLLAGAAIVARVLWRRAAQRAGAGSFDRLASWCPTVALLSIGLAVHVPGASPTGRVLFWSAVGLEELATAAWLLRRRRANPSRDIPNPSRDLSNPSRDREGAVLPRPNPSRDPEGAVLPPSNPEGDFPYPLPHGRGSENDVPHGRGSENDAPSAPVTQQFTRSHSPEGDDVFCGWLRVEMPAHGRTAAVHVAFCPPFAKAPAIEVHQVEGPSGRIKSVQTLPYGARLDFKLNQPSEEPATVLLRFVASQKSA